MRQGKGYRDSLCGGRRGRVLGEEKCMAAHSGFRPIAVRDVLASRRQTVWRRERAEIERPGQDLEPRRYLRGHGGYHAE